MKAVLEPAALHGTLSAIASKSDVHRLLISAALSDAPVMVELGDTAPSEDMKATADALHALGASVVFQNGSFLVQPCSVVPDRPVLDCGESGSTLRFLLPVAAALAEAPSFTGHGRLPERPVKELLDAMAEHGVSSTDDHLPLTLSGTLTPGTYRLPGNISSQYITGLLLALPLLPEDSVIALTSPLQSASYVDVTRHALSRFGIVSDPYTEGCGGYRVPGGQQYRSPGRIRADGDWSNAAFFLAAGALTSHPDGVTVTGLDPESPQGDKKITELLQLLDTNGDRTIDLTDIPDLLPILAVVAATADGVTTFTGGERLRIKESDRLTAVCTLLRSLGARAEETPDGLRVTGTAGAPLPGGTVDAFRDHRIVMAAAVASLRTSGPVTIEGAEAVSKSYPSFFDDFNRLGGTAHVI